MLSNTLKHNHSISNQLGELLSGEPTAISRRIRHIVIVGCVLNAILMVLKLGVGYYGHSDALVADGFHSLNDFAADLIMLLFLGISFKKADGKYSYGYGKYETFSTFIISIFLLFVAFHITEEAIDSIKGYAAGEVLPQPDIWTVIIVVVSMVTKEFLFRYYRKGSKETGTVALLTNAWHHRSDAMASIATLLGVSFAHFLGESWRILDPCASLVLVVFIVVASVRMLVPAFRELMDHTCSPEVTDKASSIIESTKGVERLIELKTRKNGHFLIFDVTVDVNGDITINKGREIASEIRMNLIKEFGHNLMISVVTESSDLD
ncbi:MAG: cation transporter [Bacteroidales bacterium]|nr:cation transporter [Bacteroidales bacterium]